MTQVERVIRHLEDYGEITSLDAFNDYRITRLSAVIFNIKKMGMKIDTHRGNSKNRYGERTNFAIYKLVKE